MPSKRREGGERAEEIIGSYRKFIPELIRRAPEESALHLRNNSSLIATKAVGVSPHIGNVVLDALARGQVEIIPGQVKTLTETRSGNGIIATMTPSVDVDDGNITMRKNEKTEIEFGGVISCLGREMVCKDDPLWKNLLERGEAVPHATVKGDLSTITNLGAEIDEKCHLIGKNGLTANPNVSLIGPMVAGKLLETEGTIGPEGIGVVSIRKQSLHCTNCIVERLAAQKPVNLDTYLVERTLADRVRTRNERAAIKEGIACSVPTSNAR